MSVRKTLCRFEAIPDGGAVAVSAEHDGIEASVVLLRQRERVHAYWNECPHAGRRLDWAPGRFLIENGRLVCAAHGACFAIGSGLCVDGPARGSSLARLAVEIVDGEVCLA
jgi:nitrite reductase/ring-hydroxylating ferredoxin subunit